MCFARLIITREKVVGRNRSTSTLFQTEHVLDMGFCELRTRLNTILFTSNSFTMRGGGECAPGLNKIWGHTF